MRLKAIVEEQVYTLNVPDAMLHDATDFFARLDADMSRGWQMSRDWVDTPGPLQRCQIVADKLLTALEKDNRQLGLLMAAYILNRLPRVEAVELDVQGEIQNIEFHFAPAAESPAVEAGSEARTPSNLSKMDAITQAGHDVTQVFKVGKGYRFSVFDHATGSWRDAPLAATQAEAERLRQLAFNERYEVLRRQT